MKTAGVNLEKGERRHTKQTNSCWCVVVSLTVTLANINVPSFPLISNILPCFNASLQPRNTLHLLAWKTNQRLLRRPWRGVPFRCGITLTSDEWKVCLFCPAEPRMLQAGRSCARRGGGEGRSEAPAGGEPVNAPLTRRPWRPETRMKARASNDKQIRPGHHGDATCRCVQRLHPEIKSRRRHVQIEFHYSSVQRCQGSPFSLDKRSALWARCSTWRADAKQGVAVFFFFFVTHLSDSFKPSISEQTAQISTALPCPALHPSIINLMAWKQVLGSSPQLSTHIES